MEYTIRKMQAQEYPLLEDFLYEAIFIPEGVQAPSKSIIHEPLLWRTIDGFGMLKDDCCLVADVGGKPVGAVWIRVADQYGYLDDDTPSFSISLYPEYRNKGIGTAMMRAMLGYLVNSGYKRASLSVQKENYAVRMYKSVGFKIVDEDEQEFIMIHNLSGTESKSTCI